MVEQITSLVTVTRCRLIGWLANCTVISLRRKFFNTIILLLLFFSMFFFFNMVLFIFCTHLICASFVKTASGRHLYCVVAVFMCLPGYFEGEQAANIPKTSLYREENATFLLSYSVAAAGTESFIYQLALG